MNDEEKEEHERVFLERNKEILKTLLKNCEAAIEKSDLDTFKKMITERKTFNCIMAAPGFVFKCALTIELNTSEKKDS